VDEIKEFSEREKSLFKKEAHSPKEYSMKAMSIQ
jgi:hypothetical protein